MTAKAAEQGQALLSQLGALETGVWEALMRGDQMADEAALAGNFLGVYPDGFASKADHVQQLAKGPTIQSFRLSKLTAMALGDDYALLSYRAAYLRVGRTEPEAMYVSSIWRRGPERWVNVFSQDTPAID